MFSRKRHFYEKKTFYAAVMTAFSLMMALSLWMNGEPVSEEPANPEPETQVSSDQVEQNIGQAGITGHSAVEKAENTGYFVIEEDQLIKVYLVDAMGSKKLVRTTDISYDLLGAGDQELFRSGVHLENEEQLMELLQDFES